MPVTSGPTPPSRTSEPAPSPTKAQLYAALADVTLLDEHRLRRKLRRADSADALERVARDVEKSRSRLQRRLAVAPHLDYPAQLPVSAARDEIAAALQQHQVIVVAGETGSGKTTQLPKICLELGRGRRGMIGHTQPRRLAARAVATRIAEECQTELGTAVGFSVRFTDQVSDTTLVKLMTDGILLREITKDRFLRAYDTLIIDEAHERSLNIDFILGYLKQLLPKRPDLKVIITSATIEPGRFAEHFAGPAGPAPIIEVSGRTYPVEIRYRPLQLQPDDPEHEHVDLDQQQAISAAVDELCSDAPSGDILVFLPTEREIRDTEQSLRHLKNRGIDILPLYARLSNADQQKVFAPHSGRRIVLSTNVAETSLTVPGIRYVIDAGTARISRYSYRTKVQRLPIEPISQASARQRAGRCGRVADGICIRLYSEDDYESRPEHTDPEILRTNLAAVILQMTALGLGDIAAFPFVQAPDPKSVRDGVALLEELGALNPVGTSQAGPSQAGPSQAGTQSPERTLTPVGRELSQLPVDPRLGRMLVAAHQNGALAEMLILVAALSIPDVRERPAEHRQAADETHARFAVPGSEFLSYLELWKYLGEQQKTLSGNQFRKQCGREFLHWLRIREWRDLHGQLSRMTKDLGWQPNSAAATPDVIHQSVLAGLLSHIGLRDAETREFLGARGTRFAIFPGSSLAKKPPRFVVAAELVETSRLWARTVAGVDPAWAESLAGPLAKRSYSEPRWSAKRSGAVAAERVTLYGVTLAADRLVPLGRIDPPLARELFIRHALVEGDWRTSHAFFQQNRELLEDVAGLEDRARRRDLVVSDDALFDFYDKRIPDDVVSGRHFDTWWRKERRKHPDSLTFTADDVAAAGTDAVQAGDFPGSWVQGSTELELRYRFSPGDPDDGVTAVIPLPLLPTIRAAGFDWLVPGYRAELAAELIRTLPKALRRQVVPAPDIAAAALARLRPRSEPLVTGLAREVSSLAGVALSPGDLRPTELPAHLRMTYLVVDDRGRAVASGKSLPELQQQLADSAEHAHREAVDERGGPPARDWSDDTFGTLEREVVQSIAGQQVTGYPGLAVSGDGVRVRVFITERERDTNHHLAVRRLLDLQLTASRRNLLSVLDSPSRLALSQSPYRDTDRLIADCRLTALDDILRADALSHNGLPRTTAEFAALRERVRAELGARTLTAFTAAVDTLREVGPLRSTIDGCRVRQAADDVVDQLENLVFDGFVGATALAHLQQVPRYLRAARTRLEALPASQSRDTEAMAAVDRTVGHWNSVADSVSVDLRDDLNERAGWIVEELRVGLFAQRLGTAYPISEKRAKKMISELR
ncbi:ATP-dependent RNA helicase HrpA [Jongsikchunia kroppenstedtii]|uniref:ATP-dependent RNA helicase HrpA n=1 Tax=Jongsikchunia kroppenstedtii TaxID=1121721 RepID=UPI000374D1AA|nr:ATP-dependent RNA helicase HrpA [Jongsikchunia kroppenstedtii]